MSSIVSVLSLKNLQQGRLMVVLAMKYRKSFVKKGKGDLYVFCMR